MPPTPNPANLCANVNDGDRDVKKVLMVALGILTLLGCDNSPEAKEKASKRDGIDYCWSTYKKKSNSDAEKRFIAGACEKMEDDFRAAYGVKP